MKRSRPRASEIIGLNDIIGGPLPSRRVLDELRPFLPDAVRGVSPVARAFSDLDRALASHTVALAALDRTEADRAAVQTPEGQVGARHGRRTRAVEDGAESDLRSRPTDLIARRPRVPSAGSKRRALVVRQAREIRLGRLARDSAAYLLSAPVSGLDDIALKLAVLIAAGEAGPPEAAAFPWFDLRLLLADLSTARRTGA